MYGKFLAGNDYWTFSMSGKLARFISAHECNTLLRLLLFDFEDQIEAEGDRAEIQKIRYVRLAKGGKRNEKCSYCGRINHFLVLIETDHFIRKPGKKNLVSGMVVD